MPDDSLVSPTDKRLDIDFSLSFLSLYLFSLPPSLFLFFFLPLSLSLSHTFTLFSSLFFFLLSPSAFPLSLSVFISESPLADGSLSRSLSICLLSERLFLLSSLGHQQFNNAIKHILIRSKQKEIEELKKVVRFQNVVKC